jgi:hypothetical protein
MIQAQAGLDALISMIGIMFLLFLLKLAKDLRAENFKLDIDILSDEIRSFERNVNLDADNIAVKSFDLFLKGAARYSRNMTLLDFILERTIGSPIDFDGHASFLENWEKGLSEMDGDVRDKMRKYYGKAWYLIIIHMFLMNAELIAPFILFIFLKLQYDKTTKWLDARFAKWRIKGAIEDRVYAYGK